MYVRLAITEEREAARAFGAEWDDYAEPDAALLPNLGASGQTQHHA